jgi:hypothetical protein
MAGVKGAKAAARKLSTGPKKHYCQRCIGTASEYKDDMQANPVLVVPGRKIFFICKKGHKSAKGTTVVY